MVKEGERALSRGCKFIKAIAERIVSDPGFGAALRHADNPATEYQAWEHLIRYGCDIEKKWERLPYATVAAAAARARITHDGQLPLGKSIAACFEKDADPAKAKLRRLLSCSDVEEACTILRPLLNLIASRGIQISYGRILDDLLYFGERVKLRWASEFFRTEGDLR
jgi:CRISPR system Cascade subunit CasB